MPLPRSIVRSTPLAFLMVWAFVPGAGGSSGLAGADTSAPEAQPQHRLPFIGGTYRSREVVPGVTYTLIRDPSRPLRIHVLDLVPAATDATIDVALARSRYPGFATVSRMAKRGQAIAAVNGDFGLWPGRPAHGFAMDGALIQTPVIGGMGHSFAVSDDESELFVGDPARVISAYRVANDKTWEISHWNEGRPTTHKIVGFTPVGGDLEQPPKNACSVRIHPSSAASFTFDGMGVTRDYTVEIVSCSSKPMEMLPDSVVLSSRLSGNGADKLSDLAPGETLTLSWTYGWKGVLDSISGSPTIIDDGVITTTKCPTYLCNIHPRTAVGTTADGHVLIVVVDGRTKKSVGLNMLQLAKTMKALGCVEALNLDGGGSSEMWIQGEIVNKPSDGRERRVSSALLILPGLDLSEPLGPQVRTPERDQMRDDGSTARQRREAWRAARNDPGSTGGLLGLP